MEDIKVGDITVELPKPIHMPGLRAKLDVFAADHDKIHKWVGSSNIATLFYLYLFNKYKSHCVLSSEYNTNSPLGLYINNEKNPNPDIRNVQFEQIATQMKKCIIAETPVIIIPMVINFGIPAGSHANVLIYRNTLNTIEHFEPHGRFKSSKLDSAFIGTAIQRFVDIINLKLVKSKKITLLHGEDVCPAYGLQSIEGEYGKLLAAEGEGYCQAWSLFITELALRNPKIPSKILIDNLLTHVQTKRGGEYLRKVIRGYVVLIYDKIDRYYSAMVGSPLTPEVLTNKNNEVPLMHWVGTLVRVEMELMNDPNISTKRYIHRLKKFKTSIHPKWTKRTVTWYNNPDNYFIWRDPEPANTRKIHIAKRIDKLLNPSHSSRTLSDHSITLSDSSIIPFESNHSPPNNNPYFNSPRTYSRSPQYPSSSPKANPGNKRKRTPSSNSASKRKHPVLDHNNSSKTRRNSKDN